MDTQDARNPEEPQKDFFISYTHADQRWAEWIAWQLEAEGYTTVIQAWDFGAGSHFVHEMDTAAKKATCTIAVLSPDYFASDFTPSEWQEAFRRDPKGERGLLLPVRVRPCDVEGMLRQVVYIDLVEQDETAARARLVQGVKHERRKPNAPPAFPSSYQASAPSALQTSPSYPGALPSIWNIPYPRNPYFTGRENLLQDLATSLRKGETVGISQPQAVSGLGGVGKTQIALEYAYRYYQDYDTVLWTRADTEEALISGFVAFAGLLQLPEQEERDQLKAVQAVKRWLASHTRWLLLLDNADDLTLARDYLPSAGRGHTLLTTRASSMGRVAHAIEVDTLDDEPGALFFLRRANLLAADAPLEQAEQGERAMQICQELGGLPLALDQAGAYIEETQCSLVDYLPLYRSRRAALLKARGGLVLDHPEPVAATWSLSFEKVEQRSPIAADLLRVCAFLHPDAIPEEIITEGASKLGPHLQTVAQDPLAFNQAIGVLLSYSLVKRQPEEHLLSVHRLVQAVLKDGMDTATSHHWIERVVQAVEAALPDDVEYRTYTTRYERCLPHVQECARLIEQEQLTSFAARRLLYQTGIYLAEHARYAEAEAFYKQSLHIREDVLEPDHPEIAYPLIGLAELYREQGNYEEAEPLYQRALHIWEQAYGPEHPLTKKVARIYAILLRETGREDEAKELEARFPSD